MSMSGSKTVCAASADNDGSYIKGLIFRNGAKFEEFVTKEVKLLAWSAFEFHFQL